MYFTCKPRLYGHPSGPATASFPSHVCWASPVLTQELRKPGPDTRPTPANVTKATAPALELKTQNTQPWKGKASETNKKACPVLTELHSSGVKENMSHAAEPTDPM